VEAVARQAVPEVGKELVSQKKFVMAGLDPAIQERGATLKGMHHKATKGTKRLVIW
jgi:hypothetical protein